MSEHRTPPDATDDGPEQCERPMLNLYVLTTDGHPPRLVVAETEPTTAAQRLAREAATQLAEPHPVEVWLATDLVHAATVHADTAEENR